MKQKAAFSVCIDTIVSPASRTDFGSSSMHNKMPLHTVFISSMDDSVRSSIACYTLANRIIASIALEGSVYDGMVA